jgi:hypothetical protein
LGCPMQVASFRRADSPSKVSYQLSIRSIVSRNEFLVMFVFHCVESCWKWSRTNEHRRNHYVEDQNCSAMISYRVEIMWEYRRSKQMFNTLDIMKIWKREKNKEWRVWIAISEGNNPPPSPTTENLRLST